MNLTEKHKNDNPVRCDCCNRPVSYDELKRGEPREDVHRGAMVVILNGHERHWVTVPSPKR